MKAVYIRWTLCFYFICLLPVLAWAQEENNAVQAEGTRYVTFKLKSVEKYNARLEQQQKKLIKKLKKKEERFAAKLKRTDSVAYARFKQQKPTYDSIGKLMDADSATMAAKTKGRRSPITDSLKGITAFVQSKEGGQPSLQLPGVTAQISTQQAQLNYHAYINDLITQHTNSLQSIATSGNIPGFSGIAKQVYYGKAKMNVYKEMEEDPTKAEDKALEYLEGTEGFDGAMNSATQSSAGNSIQGLNGSNASAGDLQQMGFQTKSQLQGSLQQKFGGNIGGVAQQAGNAVTQFQSQMNGIQGAINDAKQTKQSMTQLKNTKGPSFKVNPMRGLPFWKRVQKQYTWQTVPASADGTTPAMMEASAMWGFKQSPKLVYSAGIASQLGLGQNWSNVHFSFQGVGFISSITWQWQYGIGLYLGYERMYKQAIFTQSTPTVTTDLVPTPHNTDTYSESVLVGLTKNYNINSKYTGAIQVLYDIWWQQKGLRSPILIRFATITK